MGMGDKPQTFTIPTAPVFDNVLRVAFAGCAMRPCPHPAVQKKYGMGGECNVSVYVCRGCKFAVRHRLFAGYICDYKEE